MQTGVYIVNVVMDVIQIMVVIPPFFAQTMWIRVHDIVTNETKELVILRLNNVLHVHQLQLRRHRAQHLPQRPHLHLQMNVNMIPTVILDADV